MDNEIKQIIDENISKIVQANTESLNSIRISLLGKKGVLTNLLKQMKDFNQEKKQEFGKSINEAKQQIEEAIKDRERVNKQNIIDSKIKNETLDVTLPGEKISVGTQHVLDQMLDEIEDHFVKLGYQVMEGNEVESDEYNFERLNLPKNHPARDMQDTFYITPEILLRTQTSAMQARAMEVHDFSTGPLKMISPGVVYRRDTDDATHSHQFHQVEGLVVGEKITMANLKASLLSIAQEIFGPNKQIRLRPSYFPFTEPSVEVDVSWSNEATSEATDWIEVLGAGMVHPNVLELNGVDSSKYSGFAFGLGPDRFAMLKYGITDIRQFYLNDVRFIQQFKQGEIN